MFIEMRFSKAIKKIIALGTGATMMGATLMGAMAADLSNYPSPFIKDGKLNGVMVIGNNAAAEDVVGVTDIAVSLQYSAKQKAGTVTSEVSVEGDAWKVGTSTKKFEISENAVETLRNITKRIDDAELDVLAGGEVANSKGTAPYSQYLYLLGPDAETDLDTGYVTFVENGDDVTADFLYFKSGEQIGKYLLDFSTALESDVDDSTGSSDTTGTYLTDMEDIDIVMFGKKYTIVQARRLTSSGGGVKFVMMGGAVKDTLVEGETKTYTLDGKDYETTLDYVSASQTRFTINGETSRLLGDGDTDKLSDSTELGVSEILYQDYAGGIHSATFFIGAQKLELKDSDVEDTSYSYNMKVGDNTIDDAYVTIEATDDNNTFKLERIHINMTADDDFYVPAGGKLSEVSDLVEPEVLFTNQWDIEYHGLKEEDIEVAEITTSGSSKYTLKFIDGDGEEVSLSLAESPSADSVLVKFKNQENTTIAEDDKFILTDSTASRGERKTYALQYKGADKVTSDTHVLKFKNLGDGSTIEQSYSAASSVSLGLSGGEAGGEIATLKLGGSDYKVYNASSIKDNDFGIRMDLDGDGSMTSNHSVNITTKYGLEINVHNCSTNAINVTFKTPDDGREGGSKNTVQSILPTDFSISIYGDSNGKVDFTTITPPAGTALSLLSPEDEDNVNYGYTSYGTYIKHEQPTSSPDTLKIEYPKEQREALVYITAKGASVSSVESDVGEGEAVVVNKIEVGATKLASEVDDIKATNAILVGGPCANVAAAEVMGNPADCSAGFEAGKGLIQLFENDGNVAMLIAGYSAADTRAAATVIANYRDYSADLKGTVKEVMTATMTLKDITTPVEEEDSMMEDDDSMMEEEDSSEEGSDQEA